MGKRRTQSLIDSNSSDSDSDADNNLESVSDTTKVVEQIAIRAQPPMSCEEGMIDAIAKKIYNFFCTWPNRTCCR